MTNTQQLHLGAGRLAPETVTTPGTEPAAQQPAPSRLDRRKALVAVAFLAPPAMAAQYLLAPPGLPRDAAEGFLVGIAADPDRYTWAIAAYLVSMAAGLAAAVVLALAGRRTAYWLSGIAASLMAVGSVGGGGFAGIRLAAVALTDGGSAMPGGEVAWTRLQEGAGFSVLLPFVGMAVLGTLVAVAALVKARADVTWWAAPAYLVGFVLTSGEFPTWVSVIGAAVQVAGLALVGRAALRD
jgi:hypothetical protein